MLKQTTLKTFVSCSILTAMAAAFPTTSVADEREDLRAALSIVEEKIADTEASIESLRLTLASIKEEYEEAEALYEKTRQEKYLFIMEDLHVKYDGFRAQLNRSIAEWQNLQKQHDEILARLAELDE